MLIEVEITTPDDWTEDQDDAVIGTVAALQAHLPSGCTLVMECTK